MGPRTRDLETLENSNANPAVLGAKVPNRGAVGPRTRDLETLEDSNANPAVLGC